ncbi:MAG: Xaa-Pro peptidase family protein [Actinobacteria bacterium]|nr:Xaa-Pro peptidase family protein [Actinomycetota bacterium]
MSNSRSFDYANRISRLRDNMGRQGIDVVMLSVGSDLPYFTGYEAMPSERLTMLLVDQLSDPSLFVPQLEGPRVAPGPFDIVSWPEAKNPISLVAEKVGSARRIAVGDNTWSAFLVALQAELPHAEWTLASELTRGLRIRKEPGEIASLRAAAEAADRVLARVPGEVRFSGRTEHQIARDFSEMTLDEGHDMASFAIVASGPNGASPHHEPGDRIVQKGDLVVCDFGGRVDGYHSDVTRTFSVGPPTAEQVEVHHVVAKANAAGRAAARPGVPCQEIDRAARSVIEDAGYGRFFIHRTGHGIGLEVHEHPYLVQGNDMTLESGMSFSVEPGIYLPDRLGVRIEDIVTTVDNGVDELNRADRGLIEVG